MIGYNKSLEAVLAVTYKCNARCKMCNIWKSKPQRELLPEEFKTLSPNLRTINISGGEPFLRDDLPEIIRVINKTCNFPRMVISTNGLLPEKIKNMMIEIQKQSKKIGVGISVDGVGDMHDKIRGVRGAYEKALHTIENMKSIGIRDLRIGFTISDINVEHLKDVYDLSSELGIEFTCSVAQNSEHHFMIDNNELKELSMLKDQLSYVVNKELSRGEPKKWFRAYYSYGIFHHANKRGRILPCDAGSRFFFMTPDGNIYPCDILNRVMGNSKEKSVDYLWKSKEALEIRDMVNKCEQNCWMVCTARTAIKKNIIKAGYWIVKSKIKNLTYH